MASTTVILPGGECKQITTMEMGWVWCMISEQNKRISYVRNLYSLLAAIDTSVILVLWH